MGSAAKMMMRVLVQMVAIVRQGATTDASMGDSWHIGDDFRVCIVSRDLPEPMYQRMLTRELSRRLGYQGKASRDTGQVIWYAPSAGSAEEIAQVAREVLARPDVGRYRTAPVVRTERWIRRNQYWRDVTGKPSSDIAAELQAEHEARQERERETSVKYGLPPGWCGSNCRHTARW